MSRDVKGCLCAKKAHVLNKEHAAMLGCQGVKRRCQTKRPLDTPLTPNALTGKNILY